MAMKTYYQELETSVSVTRIFKAFCIYSHNFLPNVLPDTFKSIEFVQGNYAAPDSVKLIKYISEGESKCAKHKIDEVDTEKFYYKYTVIEGDKLEEKIESIVVEVKMEAKGTGSMIKIKTHFHTKDDAELDEERLKIGKEKAIKSFKVVDEYLQANPDVYA